MSTSERQVALVTGASSGIGVDFARQLAARDFDLVIAARRFERLQKLGAQLEEEFGVKVTPIQNDLAERRGAIQLCDEVKKREIPVKMLVNNAGLGHFGPLLDQQTEEMETVIQVNLTSLTTLTKIMAAEMKRRGGGYILNNSSFSAIQPTPDYALYSATKSYVLAFSLALRHALKKDGVRVTALCPGFFDSEFMRQAGQRKNLLIRLITIDRALVARAGLRGVLRGKAVVIPGVLYKTLNLTMRLFPRTFATAVADFAVRGS